MEQDHLHEVHGDHAPPVASTPFAQTWREIQRKRGCVRWQPELRRTGTASRSRSFARVLAAPPCEKTRRSVAACIAWSSERQGRFFSFIAQSVSRQQLSDREGAVTTRWDQAVLP